MFFRWLPAVVVLLWAISSAHAAGQATSVTDADQQLEEINRKIQSLNKKNMEREGALGKIQLKLRSSDKLIESTTKDLKKLGRQVRSTKKNLRKLEAEKASQSAKLNQHQEKLAEQLRSLQRSGKLARLLGLTKSQPLQQYLRNQTYFLYLQQARSTKIAEIDLQQARMLKTRQAFATRLGELNSLNTAAQKKKDKLANEKNSRQKTVTELQKGLKSSRRQIDNLDENRRQLNELIERLRFVKAHPKGKSGRSAFARLMGKLQWPVKGKVAKTTSAPGVTIHVEEGLDVRAISGGRVVFADWMRGLGLLTIIDHGAGYMSLYGNNQSLLKKPGERVEPGSVIAITGSSGGKAQSGLYFEIRKNAKPLDPRKWCRSS